MNCAASKATWAVVVFVAVSALANCILVFMNSFLEKDLNNVMSKARTAQVNQSAVQNLANELANYGRKHPDIFNILKKYGVNPPPDTPKPTASKPTGAK